MIPLYGYIVTTETRYNNAVDVGGKELIVNTEISERDAQFVARIATVEAVPLFEDTPVKPTDQIIIHHNVFRRWYDVKGRERNGRGFMDDGRFIVYPDQVYGYNSGRGWEALPGYCFVAPLAQSEQWSLEIERPLMGELVYKAPELDIPIGTIVGFVPGSEYEFVIDSKKLYRILSSKLTWITKRNASKSSQRQRSHSSNFAKSPHNAST